MDTQVEKTRLQYRPAKVLTLFVGESAPISGQFFYFGNTGMTRHMQRAVEEAFGPSGNFLHTFKSLGWYLDDLSLSPINHLAGAERKAACAAARGSLADRIKQYEPLAIVTLMKGIADDVEMAALMAQSPAARYVVSFPGQGRQGHFRTEIGAILDKLPRASVF